MPLVRRRDLRALGEAIVAAPDPRRFDDLDTLDEAYAVWLTTHRNPAIVRLNEVLSAPAPPPSRPAAASTGSPPPSAPGLALCPDPSKHRAPRATTPRPHPETVGAIVAQLGAGGDGLPVRAMHAAAAVAAHTGCSRATSYRALADAIRAGWVGGDPRTNTVFVNGVSHGQ